MEKPSKHNTLNAKQLHLLKLAYKFRFITAPLMADYKGLKSRHAMYMTLERLAKQKYLGKRTDSNSNFQNKGIRYYLTPDGLKVLKDKYGFSNSAIFALYKNNIVSENFIEQYSDTLRVYLRLRASYPEVFHMFTKTELLDYDNFPEQLPNLYLNRIQSSELTTSEYMAYILPPTQLFILKKFLNMLLEHFDSGDWEEDYPTIVLVCPDSGTEERVQKHIASTLDSAGIDDLLIYTTSLKALLNSDKQNLTIWSSVYEPGKLLSLS